MDISVIISTYNNPDYLALVLEGYGHQDDSGFEVVIADDGSGPETGKLIEKYKEKMPYPITHAWQEDKGFRLAAARNMGIRRSSTDYCVFTDQDCIPARDFVALHRRHRRKGCFLVGGYVRMTEEFSRTITPESVEARAYLSQLDPRQRRKLWYRHLAAFYYNFIGKKDRPRIIGMNFSVWKADLVAVNGFDENYVGWGREESDLRTRLRCYGLKGKSLWPYCLGYHIWHPHEASKKDVKKNIEYYYKHSRRTWCENGLNKPG